MGQTYTVKQVAEILGYSTNSIYTFLKEGRIKGVRVGQGRFRITEEELQTILHLSKKTSPPIVKQTSEFITKPIEIQKPVEVKLNSVSLFDWFIGSASIIVGLSFFLYSKYVNELQSSTLLAWMNVVQITMIFGGIGFLITEAATDQVSKTWHKIFNFVLIAGYASVSVVRLGLGDNEGAMLFGILLVIIFIKLLKLLKGAESFLIFIILYSIAMPLRLLINMDEFVMPDIFTNVLNPTIFLITSVIGAVFAGILLWISYYSQKKLFTYLIYGYGLMYVCFAFWFASNLVWVKSFFLIVTALTCFLFSCWECLHLPGHISRKKVIYVFLLINTLLILIQGTLYVMEQNIKEFARIQVFDKINYAELILDTTLSTTEKTTTALGNNRSLAAAIKDKDGEKIKDIIKASFDGNQLLRRVLVLDQYGNLLTVYPYIELTEPNYAFRDYFINVKNSNKLFISDVFETRTNTKTNTVVISGPIIDNENNFAGVIVSSINLDTLSLRLQRIANQEQGEYIMVLDKKLKRIIHPDPELIGSQVEKTNFVYSNFDKKEAIGEGYNVNRDKMLQAFSKVEQTQWYVEVQAPLIEILSLTKSASIGLFSILSLIILGIGFYASKEKQSMFIKRP